MRSGPDSRSDHCPARPIPRKQNTMTDKNARPVGPPTRHQLALMIWLCVFPTLTVINVTLADWLRPMSPVLRTFVLATIAVPIVIYGLMPQLHRARVRILALR
jgi:antibiotic biosynthesis monooxygenase (ABM) superfamily enzyme